MLSIHRGHRRDADDFPRASPSLNPNTVTAPQPVDDPLLRASLDFKRQLGASEQIAAVAYLLWHTLCLYEGRSTSRSAPLLPEQQRAASHAACLAVRYLSTPTRETAERMTLQLALNTWEQLHADLKSCDLTPEDEDERIRMWVRGLLSTFTHHLTTAVGRSKAENEFYDAAMLDFEREAGQLMLPPMWSTTGE